MSKSKRSDEVGVMCDEEDDSIERVERGGGRAVEAVHAYQGPPCGRARAPAGGVRREDGACCEDCGSEEVGGGRNTGRDGLALQTQHLSTPIPVDTGREGGEIWVGAGEPSGNPRGGKGQSVNWALRADHLFTIERVCGGARGLGRREEVSSQGLMGERARSRHHG